MEKSVLLRGGDSNGTSSLPETHQHVAPSSTSETRHKNDPLRLTLLPREAAGRKAFAGSH
ncbi:hypothetical protein E2C01_077407 [Portunus trituberculatus]|uniref:Uncharacterized protein n=1 Tax=Portunus trituberculatus TaxID=210409 RepID=A0A5B7IM73_PORTR|nr:hypothetical protein [Portunus trituberculatus]